MFFLSPKNHIVSISWTAYFVVDEREGGGRGGEIQYFIDFSMSLSLISVIIGDPGAVSQAVSKFT